MTYARHLTALLVTSAALSLSAQAGEPTAPSAKATATAVAPKEKSVYDQIWGLAKLYENKDNPILQEVSFAGRYHGQYHWTDADSGSYEEWENRRFRAGR